MTAQIDLYKILKGNDDQTNFTTMLLKLVFKADDFNRARLRLVFPEEVKLVEHYIATGEILGMDNSKRIIGEE